MNKNNAHKNDNHNTLHDALTEVLQNGAAKLLRTVVEAEVQAFCDQYPFLRDDAGHRRIVRNGYLPDRKILTGIGEVSVKVPRTRDRLQSEEDKIYLRVRSFLHTCAKADGWKPSFRGFTCEAH